MLFEPTHVNVGTMDYALFLDIISTGAIELRNYTSAYAMATQILF